MFNLSRLPEGELYADIVVAAIEYVVERTPFQKALEKRGRTIDDCLNTVISQQHSSPQAVKYTRNHLEEVIGKVDGQIPDNIFTTFLRKLVGKERVSQAYVVKKIICNPDDYDAFAEAISDEGTEKIRVIRIIGNARNESAKDFIGFKTPDKGGYGMYLIRAYSPDEAIGRSGEIEPTLKFTPEERGDFTPKAVKIMDEVGMTLFSTYDWGKVNQLIEKMETQELMDSENLFNIPL